MKLHRALLLHLLDDVAVKLMLCKRVYKVWRLQSFNGVDEVESWFI